jgi:hypothetical protein
MSRSFAIVQLFDDKGAFRKSSPMPGKGGRRGPIKKALQRSSRIVREPPLVSFRADEVSA